MELLENEVELVKEVCKRIKIEAGRLKPLKILDIGCGAGKFAIYLREETGCEVIGIDPVREKIEKARSRSSSVLFEVQSAEELLFANHTFDMVTSLKALHEIPDFTKALKESHRVLKERGKILIIDWVAGAARTGSHAHAQRYFSSERLQEALSEAGFGAIHITTSRAGELMLGEGVKLGDHSKGGMA
ncbi:MAG: class I SAM-dependent methyltransferase [Methanophagales archaeon ANME-1-THS]|nr:MAG: class I SAM-dependent methyltransferase [Methanophagales archaeon ANME-1-THS]